MCFLAEKDIPESLLPLADDELEADEATGTLKAYAFVTQREGSDSFDIHRLVRLAMRNWLDEGQRKECITSVIERLAEVFPFPEHENRDVWMEYLPHAQTALEFREDSTNEEAKRDLLSSVALSHAILGKYQTAQVMHRQTLELTEKVLGEEHPDTLGSMNNLALMLDNLGKYEEAETIYRRALEGYATVLGEEHPGTVRCRNNLASCVGHQGQTLIARDVSAGAMEHAERRPYSRLTFAVERRNKV
jgi:tetratricopeptide (TPR) repeat protein